jgi:magnesium chelatase family protein
MVATIRTVAFQGLDVLDIDVQVQDSPGLPRFDVVGLPDKAVAESRERVRGALHAMGIAMPQKRVVVNLAPADVAKEGSHFDLPIALGVLGIIGVLPREELAEYIVLGELGLDAGVRPVSGVLPAALHAATENLGLICPRDNGGEAAWAGELPILAPATLLQIINHFRGQQVLPRPIAHLDTALAAGRTGPDLSHVRGQETAKRALEVAAAGAHNLLLIGPPGAGKSMLASCLPSILPELTPREALEVSIIHSLAGTLPEGGLVRTRPYRDPHHSASTPALVGGGHRVKPGEISLAHHGVLFLDELPEFNRDALEALRQPLETGQAVIARVNTHATYPARFQLVAAMNPCRCGYLGDPNLECTRAPRCGDYQNKLSGPLLDRIDMQIDVPALAVNELTALPMGEASSAVAARVARARALQLARAETLTQAPATGLNAHLQGPALEAVTKMTPAAQARLEAAVDKWHLSARGYFRLLRVARTIADLAGGPDTIDDAHIAEALSYRRLRYDQDTRAAA